MYRVYFVLLCFLFSFNSYANKTVDLFVAKALVINQSQEVRRQAAVNSLATVLVRLSGSVEVLDDKSVQQAIKNATNYLYEFRYQSTDQTITILGAEKPATELVMRFSRSPLENLLKEAKLPIWSANRPDVLLWAATNDGEKVFVGKGSVEGEAFLSVANERGLPFVTPILDLEDRATLPVSNLWAMDEESIRLASKRYQTDAILAGRFRPESNGWSGSFMLLHHNEIKYFRASEDRPIELARTIVGQVADYFASIYAVSTAGLGEVQGALLQINNVSDFGRYAQVLQYLDALTLVESATLTQVDGPILQVRVILKSDLNRFLSTLELDKKLIREMEVELIGDPYSETLSPSAATGAFVEQSIPIDQLESKTDPIDSNDFPMEPTYSPEPEVIQFIWQQ